MFSDAAKPVPARSRFKLKANASGPPGSSKWPPPRFPHDAGRFTTVTAVAVLLAGFGSSSAAAAVAVLLIVPGAPGNTVNVTVAEAPKASTPRLQVTVETPLHVPWLGAAESR